MRDMCALGTARGLLARVVGGSLKRVAREQSELLTLASHDCDDLSLYFPWVELFAHVILLAHVTDKHLSVVAEENGPRLGESAVKHHLAARRTATRLRGWPLCVSLKRGSSPWPEKKLFRGRSGRYEQ